MPGFGLEFESRFRRHAGTPWWKWGDSHPARGGRQISVHQNRGPRQAGPGPSGMGRPARRLGAGGRCRGRSGPRRNPGDRRRARKGLRTGWGR
ncbi:MAG: hypothetical protein OZSIB_0096 [Candidatus Ozemobacter sibiricus]|uniref:Uncharacterized protein n=1 Tax=Candidatus Ozemobacter sibiricus TaxID=2268124 RepID=A0A367ZN49_9BACT|nr:MAG: hypothetical protein OZSIB_0096 [Candidatus Ozemobacter sibiricus]